MPVIVPPAIMADGELMDEWANITDRIRAFYHEATSRGVAQEDARYHTPLYEQLRMQMIQGDVL